MTVALNAGDNIQTDGVDMASAGETITLATGDYFSQSVNVNKNDITIESLSGNRADVRIYGGPQVTGFSLQANGYYRASSGVNLNAVFDGGSAPHIGGTTSPLGDQKIMCTVDTDYYHHVDGTSHLGDTTPFGRAGNFYYDYASDYLWLSSDPGASIVVVSTQTDAFSGSGTGFTLQNVSVGCYQPTTQRGMIGSGEGNSHGSGWTIDNVKAFSAHGVGVQFRADDCTLKNSLVTECGQMGVGVGIAGFTAPLSANDYIDNIVDYNNEISYNNLKGYQPGHEAGGSKWAWVTRFDSDHSWYHHNLGPGLWLDINCVDYSIKWCKSEYNRDGGIVIEISGFGEIAECDASHNGGEWPNNAVGAWPSSDAGAWGTSGGIMIWESNGRYVWPFTEPLQSPYGILVHDNLVDDNRGGIFLRGGNRDNCANDGANPKCFGHAGDAYHNTGIHVYNNDIWWDEAKWSNGEHHGSFDNNYGELGFTGDARNWYSDNDYTINGTKARPPSGFAWGTNVSFSAWQAAGMDATDAGLTWTEEPGNITTGDTVYLPLVTQTPTVFELTGVQEGSGNIFLPLVDGTPVVFAPAVTRQSTDTVRINAGGPLLSDAPDWEADDTGHAYNDDVAGTSVISNYAGAIDVTSDAGVAALAPPQSLFHTERYDAGVSSMSYTIPGLDPASRYVVRLFASENFSGITGTGQRVFSVFLNSVEVKASWDLYAESVAASAGASGAYSAAYSAAYSIASGGVGQHVALVFETEVFPTAGGDITITTTNTVQSALFNGIEVQSFDKSVTLPLVAQTPVTFAPTVQEGAVLNVFLPLVSAPATVGGVTIVTNKPIYLPLVSAGSQAFAPTIETDDEGVTVSSELIGPFWADVIDVDDTPTGTPSSSQVSRTSTFLIGQNDTLPPLTLYVRNGRDAILDMSATGINPSGITFSMKNADDGSIKVDEQACSYDATTHIVTYAWAAADTNTAGEFDGEVEVTVPTGKFTAPGASPKIRITVGGEIS